MTTIRARCATCGEVGLSPEEIELHVDRSGEVESSYAFTCPVCLRLVRKPADERVIRLLITGGVEVLDTRPAPAPRATGPALTHDDLLDFHHLLQTDDWFDSLVASVGR